MLPSQILLVDTYAPLARAWREVFASEPSVTVLEADFFSREADAMVSPANSFGIMDGGLDRAIRSELGPRLQTDVQRMILDRYHGEIPVGVAEVVSTPSTRWPHLIVAPTMRVPESVAHTLNAFLSFRATLLAIARFNTPEHRIDSVVVPGLGTGIGAMDARRCAAQMRIAYDQASTPARIPSFQQIHQVHLALRSAS